MIHILAALLRAFVHRLDFAAFARWILRSNAAAVLSRRILSFAVVFSRSRALCLSALRFNRNWRSLYQSINRQTPVQVSSIFHDAPSRARRQGPPVLATVLGSANL
jgi:hypothetical protein